MRDKGVTGMSVERAMKGGQVVARATKGSPLSDRILAVSRTAAADILADRRGQERASYKQKIIQNYDEHRLMFPFVTTTTAGTILQTLLAFAVSGGRGKVETWIGAGGDASLERAIRRHGNLAENGGIFVAGFLLLELSRFSAALLVSLCGAFVAARMFHVTGLSRENTKNPFRVIGGVGRT